MSAILNQCQCCLGDCERTFYVSALGSVCRECADGAKAGQRALWRARIAGIYLGASGDNQPLPEKP